MIGQSLSLVTGESSEFARRERSVGTIKPLLMVVAIVFGIGFAGVLSAEHFTEPDCPEESCLVSLSNLLEAAATKEQSPPDSYSLNSFGPTSQIKGPTKSRVGIHGKSSTETLLTAIFPIANSHAKNQLFLENSE